MYAWQYFILRVVCLFVFKGWYFNIPTSKVIGRNKRECTGIVSGTANKSLRRRGYIAIKLLTSNDSLLM